MERILNHRTRAGVTEYLVQWEGYSAAANSWEPAAMFGKGPLLAAYRRTAAGAGAGSAPHKL